MDKSYPRDNRLIRWNYKLLSRPSLAPRCRLILILGGLIVSQLKGYLSWVQTARGRSGSILSSSGIKGKSTRGLVREDGIITLPQRISLMDEGLLGVKTQSKLDISCSQ